MEPVCTFDWYTCGRDGKWFKDLENYYCPVHGEVVRSLKNHRPLEHLVLISDNNISSSAGLLKDYEEAKQLMHMVEEQYPEAIEIVYFAMIGKHHLWLEPNHPLLELIGEELKENGLIVDKNKE